MHLKDFPDWHEVVARNWRKTKAYLLAFREPCIRIAADELDAIRRNRVLVGLSAGALSRWRPEGSWMLAVILCPGDDVAPLTAWLARHEADPARVRFYAHPGTDVFAALEAWREAGLGAPRVDDDVDAWPRLHKRFGNDLAVQILQDWG